MAYQYHDASWNTQGHSRIILEYSVSFVSLRFSLPGRRLLAADAEKPWFLDTWIIGMADVTLNMGYESASAFGADVQRYLNDEPVQACPPSAWYRFRKFARRNKRVLAVASLLCAMLMVAVAVLGISYVQVQEALQDKTQALEREQDALQEKTGALEREHEALRHTKRSLEREHQT